MMKKELRRKIMSFLKGKDLCVQKSRFLNSAELAQKIEGKCFKGTKKYLLKEQIVRSAGQNFCN